jgi:hypothetical protein
MINLVSASSPPSLQTIHSLVLMANTDLSALRYVLGNQVTEPDACYLGNAQAWSNRALVSPRTQCCFKCHDHINWLLIAGNDSLPLSSGCI